MRVEWLDEWEEHLLWCPSQIYRHAKVDDTVYTLYLRWRWDDPWEFYIYRGYVRHQILALNLRTGEVTDIEGKPVECELVSGDLFYENNLFFRDEEYRQAEKKAEELFVKWLESMRCLDCEHYRDGYCYGFDETVRTIAPKKPMFCSRFKQKSVLGAGE